MGDETKPTPARELRDALAEAVMLSAHAEFDLPPPAWDDTIPDEILRMYRNEADRLLASLPSVKLKMGWEE